MHTDSFFIVESTLSTNSPSRKLRVQCISPANYNPSRLFDGVEPRFTSKLVKVIIHIITTANYCKVTVVAFRADGNYVSVLLNYEPSCSQIQHLVD